MSKITPAPGYVLISPTDSDKPKSFEIADDEYPQRGRVIAVGSPLIEDGQTTPSPATVGDMIIHSAMGFENVRSGGDTIRFVPFSKILGVEQ